MVPEIEKMLDYYNNHVNKPIYEKTDCLCSKKLDFCIVNKNAKNLRKIFDGTNCKENKCYVSYYHRDET